MSSRVLDQTRREQGFRDQAHLDAFFAYYDHVQGDCAVCGTPGPAHWNEADASWQPTMQICPTGRELSERAR